MGIDTDHGVGSGGLLGIESHEGYLASKWAGERVLEKASRMWDIPVTCHRPMHMQMQIHVQGGDGDGGCSGSSHEEVFMSEICALARTMRCRPVNGGWKGHFSFMRVMELAGKVVRTALDGPSPNADIDTKITRTSVDVDGGGGMTPCFRVEEHNATVKVAISDIVRTVQEQEQEGDEFETLGLVHWMGRAKREIGFQWFPTSHDAVVGEGEGGTRRTTRV